MTTSPYRIDTELPPPLDDAAVELEPASLGKTALAIEADYTDFGSSQADVIGYLRAQVDELTDQPSGKLGEGFNDDQHKHGKKVVVACTG